MIEKCCVFDENNRSTKRTVNAFRCSYLFDKMKLYMEVARDSVLSLLDLFRQCSRLSSILSSI